MQSAFLYTLGSVAVVSLVSLLGAAALSIRKSLLHRILVVLVSFSAGALIGDAFLHLLPELAEETGLTTPISLAIIAGVVAFFLYEKFVCWHHCHTQEVCHTGSSHREHHHPHKTHVKPVAHTVLLGDLLHNFIDGIVIAGSYLVSIPLGIATTLAVILHEIPQELGDFGVLIHAGFSPAKALGLNFLTALSAIAGGAIGLYFLSTTQGLLPYLIAFTAGSFIYIATADLIPELHKEVRIPYSALQVAGFALGLVAMYGLLLIE